MPRLNLKLMTAITASLVAVVCIFSLAGIKDTGAVADTANVRQPQHGPKLKVAPAASHSVQAAEKLMATQALPAAPGSIPFRTKVHPDIYQSLKNQAASGLRRAVKPGGPLAALAPLAPPILLKPNVNGVNSITAGGLRPPDTHGAIGATHFVEVTNSHLDVYARTGGRARSIRLSALFKYTSTTLFDPRVVYDKAWNRWVITADSFADTNGDQRFFIAVSKTSSALGAYWIYQVVNPGSDTVPISDGHFWDFPMLGMDQDAVLISANVFDSVDNFIDCRMFAVAKALLYNGQAFVVNMRTNLAFTTQPPIVLDQNPTTFLASADFDNPTVVTLYALTNSSRDFASQTFTPATIDITAVVPGGFDVPPSAPQPGTLITLDTSDARFINAGTQVGNSLFQVHTINIAGFPVPRFYEFNTATNTITHSGIFFTNGDSSDFNASIAANANKDMFVTWTAVDDGLSSGTPFNAQVRFTGRLNTDPDGNIGSGTALFTSPTFYTGSLLNPQNPERWGDYSAVTVDPLDQTKAWVVNQTILKNTVWGSRIARIGF